VHRDVIDSSVRDLIEAAFKKAVEILTANRDLLDRSAKELLAKETLSTELV
jgi:cell division protease FtsH